MPWVVVLDDKQTFALIDGCRVVFAADDNLEEVVSGGDGILISTLLEAELERRLRESESLAARGACFPAYPVDPVRSEEEQSQISDFVAQIRRERTERDQKLNAEILELCAQIPEGVILRVEYSGGGDEGQFEDLEVFRGAWDIPKEVSELAYKLVQLAVCREFTGWQDNDGGNGVVLLCREGVQLLHEQAYRETISNWRQMLVAEGLAAGFVGQRWDWDEEDTSQYAP